MGGTDAGAPDARLPARARPGPLRDARAPALPRLGLRASRRRGARRAPAGTPRSAPCTTTAGGARWSRWARPRLRPRRSGRRTLVGNPTLEGLCMAMNATGREHDVKDLGLADEGVRRIEWADRQMPVLRRDPRALRAREAARGRPHLGLPARHHRDRQPVRTLHAGGADVVLCASNPLSTQDDVAAALVDRYGVLRLRHQGRGPRDVLLAHPRGARPPAAHHDGRRRRRDRRPARPAPRPARRHHRRHRGDDDRRHPPARDGERRRARVPRRSPSTRRCTKHLFDNRYGTGPVDARRHRAGDQLLLAGRVFVSPATAGAARASRCARAAWARRSS